MNVAAKTQRQQRGSRVAAKSFPKPTASPQPTALLAWYDRHRRRLPWRAAPGERSDPYRVWLSEIMLQQTTVKAVAPYYARFLARWPELRTLAAAPLEEVLKTWAGLGYYSRARNLHACARAVVDQHGGIFPMDQDGLRLLPGIGAYTAAAIAAIAYDAAVIPIDGNVERVIARLYAVETALPAAKRDIARLAQGVRPQNRAGDFAQAFMDLGATICTPKRPACSLCPWKDSCAAKARGEAEAFPRRAPKREGALRRGAAFVARRTDGHILVRTRPPRGLLGGMTEVPTSAWTAEFEEAGAFEDAPLFSAAVAGGKKRVSWRRIPGIVRHVFTHFPLELVVYAADLPPRARAPKGMRWVALDTLAGEALPSLMRKVIAHGLGL